MTIIEASQVLYKYFLNNDSFIWPDDYLKLSIISDNPESDRAAFKLALEKLKDVKLISLFEDVIDNKNKSIWILEKPFKSFNQSVDISPVTANTIYEVVSSCCDQIKDKSELPDVLNIKEKDIQNLLVIMYSLIGKKE